MEICQSEFAQSTLPNPTERLESKLEETVYTYFSEKVRQVPSNLAVVDAGVAWSYSELDGLSNKLANYLLNNGIQSQDVVAIYSYRGAELVWAILGILKAGAAFVILDPAYPASRIIDCLSVAKPCGWLQIAKAGELPNDVENFVQSLGCSCRLTLSASVELEDEAKKVVIQPDNLAYIAFTSGSTGKPKAILGTHKPLSHFIEWHCQTFGFTEKDRFSMLSGLAHDPLLRDIFTPLSCGATLYIPEKEDIQTPGRLADWMEMNQISVTHLTPAMGQLLANITPTTKTNKITSLRYAFFAGEVLKQHDVARICKLAPQVTCVNFYGATETPQAMGYFVIPTNGREGTVAVGKGIKDVQLLILTKELQLAQVGEIGEIYIRTPYLSQGYLGDNNMTHEKFIINPFTQISTDKLYKTGDLGRYLSDGNIEPLGRIDNQVKIRGFRVEIGEIETTLAQHPNVRENIVIALDKSGEKSLVAYVVLSQEVSTHSLRSWVQSKLPDYMIPAAFVILPSLPLTPNGKIDRASLLSTQPKLDSKTSLAPRSELEQQLVEIWQRVLGVETVGVRDNFFDLGGHSLAAVRLLTEIQKSFGASLSLSCFIEAHTVEQLANLLNTKLKSSTQNEKSLVVIQPGATKPPLFCIHAVWGNVLFYRELALHLHPDQPLYALQARGLNENETPRTSVIEMATCYIQEIQSVQPHGPYYLGGYSFGGLVAFEIARQLQAQGEQIALLAVFDTMAPNCTESSKIEAPNHLKKLMNLNIKDQIVYIWERLEYHITVGKLSIFNKLYLRHIKRAYLDLRLIDIAYSNTGARKNYTPKFYPGKLTLFSAQQKAVGFNDPHLGWGNLTGEVENHEIPASHKDIMTKKSVELLATKLQNCLDKN